MTFKTLAFSSLVLATVIGCGPAGRSGANGDDDDGHSDGGSYGPEICNDGIDNDGDGLIDCADPDCSGIDGCPVCGEVDNPQSTPLPLPDTNQADSNPTCTTQAQCTTASAPQCIMTADPDEGPGLCATSYVDTLNFVGFAQGETLQDTSKLIAVCATMEHSWARDLQVDLISPDGKQAALLQFKGREGDEIFLGHANDCDSDANPVPGMGYKYCWTAAASTPILSASPMETWSDTACDGPHEVVPAGNYLPDTAFSSLQGAQLNGMWTFRVTDLWAEDNGYLFDWSIQFDPSLVANCSGPIIQ